ncbi:RNA polymerase subunit sigma-24 [Alishewanella longhuensis]|uniref:RNA polymerase subunit sigma-24 n=1 Tax=Alishewanella longhuensis TaxID=1091037 RepID=A0ABQ3KV60_9ALTE|nr:RNA polymerase sigma factor [Alishewanella longhuensis]GHG61081.1 RNA polymerase subunit sigma-24 [Alishewanella longhuensis]
MLQDERTMLHLVIAGDKAAYEQLYKNYLGRVYAISLRLLANQAKAEEAVQETFIKVWQQLPDFRGDSQFATWLHRIAVRTAIDMWRHDKVARLIDETYTDIPEVAQEQEQHQLDKLILRLPSQARAVFVLFAVEGYQHQEIASLLNIAEGSSKAQYHRARQLLQEWLNAKQ